MNFIVIPNEVPKGQVRNLDFIFKYKNEISLRLWRIEMTLIGYF